MRTKSEMIHESLQHQAEIKPCYASASIHDRLTLEVLIDLRDTLHNFHMMFAGFLRAQIKEETEEDNDKD